MPPHADVLQWEHLPFPKSLRDFQRRGKAIGPITVRTCIAVNEF